MKKIVSLITAFALILQLGVLSAFAVPTVEKNLFNDTSEVFGIYDCSFSHLSILQIEEEGIVPYVRYYEETDFTKVTDFSFTLLNYQLAADKKSVTANFTTYYDGVQYKGQYVFKKDASGKVFFNAVDYQGKARNIYKSYADADALYTYIDSPAFNRVLLSEKSILKKLNTFDTQLEKRIAAFADDQPISTENHLYGYYANADESQYVKFVLNYDYNTKDYSNFYAYTRIIFNIETRSYYLNAKSFVVKNGVATYLQDAKNYMEVSAASRNTVTNIKIVKNGKIVLNQKVKLSLTE